MYGLHSEKGYAEIIKGIRIKTLCYGESMLMTEFLLKKEAILPEHSHPNEQTGYLIKGKIRLFIGDAVLELVQGDSWNIAKDVIHRAEILEDSVAIEVFSPVREDYLKFVNAPDVVK
jgi:quercetin dioxygenase-like cupin family protein